MYALVWTGLWIGATPDRVDSVVEQPPGVVENVYCPPARPVFGRSRHAELNAILWQHSLDGNGYDYRRRYGYTDYGPVPAAHRCRTCRPPTAPEPVPTPPPEPGGG